MTLIEENLSSSEGEKVVESDKIILEVKCNSRSF